MRANETTIPAEVIPVLMNGTSEGNKFVINGIITPQLYKQVNEVLNRLGGTWNRSKKGHIFDDTFDVEQLIATAVETGEIGRKNEYAYFYTPQHVVEAMMDIMASQGKGAPLNSLDWCDPSAGEGHLIEGMIARGVSPKSILAVEKDLSRYETLKKKDIAQGGLYRDDFLTFEPEPMFDRIMMNPPFAVEGDSTAYITHINHAYKMLEDEGILVAVAPSGILTNQQKNISELRELIVDKGFFRETPEGSFKEAGTMVNTTLLCLKKD